MLIKALVFLYLVKAKRDENEVKTLSDPNLYNNQSEEKDSRRIADRKPPFKIPVVLANEHAEIIGKTNWTSANVDTCSYEKQFDGSILIKTMHPYDGKAYCHEYWECDNPNHNIFFKWNRVEIEGACVDWARFAWGIEDDQQEVAGCPEFEDEIILTYRQKMYRDTRGKKIVWDFLTNRSFQYWGAEAQIICKDPRDVNECEDGTHDCSETAECIKEAGTREYICKCPSRIKWGNQIIDNTGSGTVSDPCFYSHPDFPSTEIFPIEWGGETLGIVYENDNSFKWDKAFERCNELGMTLPLPSNEAENTALFNFFLERSIPNLSTIGHRIGVLLGAHNSNDENKWVNLYTNEEITYSLGVNHFQDFFESRFFRTHKHMALNMFMNFNLILLPFNMFCLVYTLFTANGLWINQIAAFFGVTLIKLLKYGLIIVNGMTMTY